MANRDLDRYRDKDRARALKLAAGRRWYTRNREAKLSKARERLKTDPQFAQMKRDCVRRWKQRNRALLWELKKAPCGDCHESFPAECMDFDHRDPKTKLRDISRMVDRPSEEILAEIAKCDLVCANCHRTRTKKRRQGVTRKKPPCA